IGRYTWPARGKYSTFQHGGLSLLECITPRIEVTL
ncbi:alkaline phosphatase, partial [Halorubrum sp. Atlit-8R]